VISPARGFPNELRCRDKMLRLDAPAVMGVLNLTPDSFSDGGAVFRHGRVDVEAALAVAQSMAAQGAAIIDVGGESTRPGASPVDLGEELRRVIPVVERLAALDTIVSVDTSKFEVARAALEAGAQLINDVRALGDAATRRIVASSGAAVCLMHMGGEPATMQLAPSYRDVVIEVSDYLCARARLCEAEGIERDRIAIDPGFGFGKTLAHNSALLRGLANIAALGYPVLVGVSRKGMIGAMTGRPVDERLAGSIAAVVIAVQNGAKIVRTHDVAATVDAVKVAARIMEET
jgi:dihydropteroate synthase